MNNIYVSEFQTQKYWILTHRQCTKHSAFEIVFWSNIMRSISVLVSWSYSILKPTIKYLHYFLVSISTNSLIYSYFKVHSMITFSNLLKWKTEIHVPHHSLSWITFLLLISMFFYIFNAVSSYHQIVFEIPDI